MLTGTIRRNERFFRRIEINFVLNMSGCLIDSLKQFCEINWLGFYRKAHPDRKT